MLQLFTLNPETVTELLKSKSKTVILKLLILVLLRLILEFEPEIKAS